MALTAQLPLVPGFSCINTFVPGGTKGMALKPNMLCSYDWEDSVEFMFDCLNRFSVRYPCGIR